MLCFQLSFTCYQLQDTEVLNKCEIYDRISNLLRKVRYNECYKET